METINNTKKRTSQLLCIDALADDAAAARRIVLNGRDVEYNECPLLVLAECRIHTKKKKETAAPPPLTPWDGTSFGGRDRDRERSLTPCH